jgi:hypothetical protein
MGLYLCSFSCNCDIYLHHVQKVFSISYYSCSVGDVLLVPQPMLTGSYVIYTSRSQFQAPQHNLPSLRTDISSYRVSVVGQKFIEYIKLLEI